MIACIRIAATMATICSLPRRTCRWEGTVTRETAQAPSLWGLDAELHTLWDSYGSRCRDPLSTPNP